MKHGSEDLDFGTDGVLYVAEAGVGGSGPCQTGPEGEACFGLTSGVSSVIQGAVTRVVTGLPSYAPADGTGATGPHDVAEAARQFLVTIGLRGDPEFRAGFGADAAWFGQLIRAKGTTVQSIVDLAAFEAANNPDKGEVDSNPYGLVVSGSRPLVTDAGGNDLLSVSNAGNVGVVAVFPAARSTSRSRVSRCRRCRQRSRLGPTVRRMSAS
ncbi:MAG: ScyD/ScyE family protein [Acidimicrobiia bacterium]